MAIFSCICMSGAKFMMLVAAVFLVQPSAANFHRDTETTWGGDRVKVYEGGRGLTLSLDNNSGSGFHSKHHYLFGRFDMQLKLVPRNSAGTVTTFYLTSPQGGNHDEIDFEFLGNVSGQPYTVHTNVYVHGKGNKEEQFHLWFNPTLAFHTYTILWNSQRIIFMVDNIPMRVFHNEGSRGIPFPTKKPMRVYCSLWNAEDWATQGGRVKTNWAEAPFVAHYRNLKINGCSHGHGSCGSKSEDNQDLDANGRKRLRWVQQKHRIYNYCADRPRFPAGLPTECNRSKS